jgi:hypothetical protein
VDTVPEASPCSSRARCIRVLARRRRRPLRLAGAAILAASSVNAAYSQTPNKIIWAHLMANMPSNGLIQYGSTHPISIYQGDYLSQNINLDASLLKEINAAGINGLSFEVTAKQNSNSPGIQHFIAFIKRFSRTGIPIAPCVDVGTSPRDVTTTIIQAYRASKAYGNAAIMQDGRLIVFLYLANNLTPDQWMQVRAKLAADKVLVFLVGDVSQVTLPIANASRRAEALVASWDAAFNFNGAGLTRQPHSNLAFSRAIQAKERQWVGSVRPAYYRGVDVPPAWGPFGVDAMGTGRLRSQWDQILRTRATWVYWSTWNDYVEHTNLLADSSWGYTRSDLNAWYSSKFRGAPYPFPPALYLTTPQSLHTGERSVVELLAINPGTIAIKVAVRLIADDGEVLGMTHLAVMPHQHAAVSLPITASGGKAVRYARAIAESPLGMINSAPIQLGKEIRHRGDHSVPNYYSVNSRLRPPSDWLPVVELDGKMARVTGLDASLIASVDLLVDGNLRDQIVFPK